MPAFIDIPTGKTPAQAIDVQQIIDALSARRNTPLATTINDPLAYAMALRNNDQAGRGIVIYAPDGSTVLFSADSAGVRLSRSGGAATLPITANDLGSAAAQAAEGNHVHGVGGYSGGILSLEALYATSWVTTSVNYAVTTAVLYVFCTLGITVTLPSAGSTNRPITVVAVAGTTTVVSTAGSVIGGSVNTSSGAIMNGIVSQGDSMTYKADSANWRVV